MSRDLLYKPPVPIVVPEDQPDGKKPAVNKLGLPVRARDLGGTKDELLKAPDPNAPQSPAASPSSAGAPAEGRAPAFKAAYFNRDVEATAQVNQRAKPMQALRGSEAAIDLRRVVLPQNNIDSPDPGQLRNVSLLMGLEGGDAPKLSDMLARQGAWAQSEGMTVEKLMAFLDRMREMVAARRIALARFRLLSSDRLSRAPMVQHAANVQGDALDGVEDLETEAATLTKQTSERAAGMHQRIAKTLGIKKKMT